MGASGSNLPANNLVVLLHLEDFKKIKQVIEQKTKEENFNIDDPINKQLQTFLKQFKNHKHLINIKKMGDTILHYASYKKNKDLVKYLISLKADTTKKNSRELTPFDVAADEEIKALLNPKNVQSSH